MKIFYDIDLPDATGGDGGGPTKPPPPKPVVTGTPVTKPTTTTPTPAPTTPPLIQRPDYNDPKSRLTFAQNWTKQYGPLMQGRGDTPLRVNETPDTGSDTSKNMAVKYFGKMGIDPALGYASSMEEGMSGMYADKNNKVDFSGDEKFPVGGYHSFGLDTFGGKFPDLVKKGYLPADFAQNFSKTSELNEKKEKIASANFKDVDSALQAKAAMLKSTYDDIDSYAKQRKITLSPKARDFFALADYNGGEGTGHQMLNDYYNSGNLEGDKFLQARPTSGSGLKATSYGPTFDAAGKQKDEGIYDHIMRRIKMADALKEQKLF